MNYFTSKIFVFFMVSLFLLQTNAHPAPSEAMKAPLVDQIGFELEVGPRHFSRLISYFDTSILEEKIGAILNTNIDQVSLKNRVEFLKTRKKILVKLAKYLDRYLENPKAFEDLPSDVKFQLSNGLNLDKPVAIEVSAKSIVNQDGKNPSNAKLLEESSIAIQTRNGGIQSNSIILPGYFNRDGTGLILPDSEKSPIDFKDANASLYQRSDWPLAIERWKKLSFEDKIKFIEFKHLSEELKTALLLELNHHDKTKSTKEFDKTLPLRATAPDWVRNLDFEFDGVEGSYSVEIKPKSPLPLEAGLVFLEQVMKSLGIDPARSGYGMQNRSDYALHIHLGSSSSKSNFPEPPSYFNKSPKFYFAFRILAILNILNANPKANINIVRSYLEHKAANLPWGITSNEYFHSLDEKGVIRLMPKSEDHVELREIPFDPKTFVKEFKRLAELSEDEAIADVNEKIKSTLRRNPNLIQAIAIKNPLFLLDLGGDIAEEYKHHILSHIVANYSRSWQLYHLFKEFDKSRTDLHLKIIKILAPKLRQDAEFAIDFRIYFLEEVIKASEGNSEKLAALDNVLIAEKLVEYSLEIQATSVEFAKNKLRLILSQKNHELAIEQLAMFIFKHLFISTKDMRPYLASVETHPNFSKMLRAAFNTGDFVELPLEVIHYLQKSKNQWVRSYLSTYIYKAGNKLNENAVNKKSNYQIIKYLGRIGPYISDSEMKRNIATFIDKYDIKSCLQFYSR